MARKEGVADGVGCRLVRGGLDEKVEDDVVGLGEMLVVGEARARGRSSDAVAGGSVGSVGAGGGVGGRLEGWRVDGGG